MRKFAIKRPVLYLIAYVVISCILLPSVNLRWIQTLVHKTIYYGCAGIFIIHGVRFVTALASPFISGADRTLVLLPRIDADVNFKHSFMPLYEWRAVPRKEKQLY
ncbi:unnamed protein product [Bursaphelenchus xylophilus]|uniref:(pine wood nematode) hypothetical protein n=1 Tax=Bursaphelenchus xylophilus TaxID=6326 RepID=A0A1I7S0L3_BURXY|nr:unnamed protein product [Bursaphelenchus xylophilus]CAG9132325.1 unnamed protein product [Bursaphelenchus xylophilus]